MKHSYQLPNTNTAATYIPAKVRAEIAGNWYLSDAAMEVVTKYATQVNGWALRVAINDGILKHDGVEYLICWHDHPEVCYRAAKCRLSLRVSKVEGIPNAVVIQPVLPSPEAGDYTANAHIRQRLFETTNKLGV